MASKYFDADAMEKEINKILTGKVGKRWARKAGATGSRTNTNTTIGKNRIISHMVRLGYDVAQALEDNLPKGLKETDGPNLLPVTVSHPAPVQGEDGVYSIKISFQENSLSRKSLYATEHSLLLNKDVSYYTGEGIDNIAALFNNGYEIDVQHKNLPYGLWENKGYYTHALQERKGSKFVNNVADDFLEMEARDREFGPYIIDIEVTEDYAIMNDDDFKLSE